MATAMKRKALHGAILGGLALAAGVGFSPLPLPQKHVRTDLEKDADKAARHEAEAKRQRKNARRAKQWLR